MSLFVNLHVKDLPASLGFFEKLGYSVDEQMTTDDAGCVNLGEGVSLLLVTEPFFTSITRRAIPDTGASTEVALALQVEGERGKVDEMLATALANGATEAGEPEDNEYMYSRSFRDLDGHLWSVLVMG
ncbi:VOC family protein [Nonomuraea sp. NPDC050790]|uniref:VOC family protein n=1 Tax=Nonomuraea sp. NPDC050790 TaxID=3364371 RepID=UPI0037913D2A